MARAYIKVGLLLFAVWGLPLELRLRVLTTTKSFPLRVAKCNHLV